MYMYMYCCPLRGDRERSILQGRVRSLQKTVSELEESRRAKGGGKGAERRGREKEKTVISVRYPPSLSFRRWSPFNW